MFFISVKFELSLWKTNIPLFFNLSEPMIVTLLILELFALHKINSDKISFCKNAGELKNLTGLSPEPVLFSIMLKTIM